MPALQFGPYTVDASRTDKVLFPDSGITKGDLIDYYREVAAVMLPHLRDRPIMMHRFPDGIDSDGFYQKQAGDYFPTWIQRAAMDKAGGGTVDHVLCQNTATLVYLADQACITPHAWPSRRDRPHHPDRMIFDLDPPGEAFGPVREAARALEKLLRELGLFSLPMTTGSRGLHVVVPLDRSAGFDAARRFARDAAELLVQRHPQRLTTAARKAARGGRLFLDTGRNAWAQTAVAPYAVRARPGAPVATPLDWKDLDTPQLRADRYTLGNLRRRLGQKDDPWRHLSRHARSLRAPRRRLSALRREAGLEA